MLNLLEIELFICIKMDLGLNNPQCLIYHKKTQTKPEKFAYFLLLNLKPETKLDWLIV